MLELYVEVTHSGHGGCDVAAMRTIAFAETVVCLNT